MEKRSDCGAVVCCDQEIRMLEWLSSPKPSVPITTCCSFPPPPLPPPHTHAHTLAHTYVHIHTHITAVGRGGRVGSTEQTVWPATSCVQRTG